MSNKLKHKNTDLMRIFFPYLMKHKGLLALDLVCASLTTVTELILPLIVKNITDTAITDAALLTVRKVSSLTLIYLALRAVDAAASYFMASGGHIMGAKIETEMRNDLFAHLQSLSYSFYDNTKIGQLMSRVTTDLFDISEFSHHFPEEVFITTIKLIVSFIIFATMNIKLALLIFSVMPFMFIVTKNMRRKMKQTFKDARHQLGEINAGTEDSLLGIRVVKSFANEHVEMEKFGRGTEKFLDIKRRNYRNMANFHTTMRIFDGIMYILIVVAGARSMAKGLTTPGDFTASLLLVSTLLTSIRRVADFSEQFYQGASALDRFAEIMDEIPEVRDAEDAVELLEAKGEIEFKAVSFAYPGTDKKVLDNLNLHIPVGGNVAIVGPSGAGKTTVCNLIPRFYEVNEGEILLDGVNIKKYTSRSLRSHIGVVQQDVYLFSGSVYDNISYGKQDADRREVEEAARKAGAHEFISQLPEGYDTYIGERGVKLSGGQKQRISIARVFLKNPPILILDEATSSLDNESERLVQKSLELLTEGRTTLTIAHRLTTIKNANEILVLTEDGIAEQGNHKELFEKDGIYRDLYNMYTFD
ncbi:MAG: ABC transporter ATP-binding protein [Clostridiales bacterium]|nr:ABC transporter ATP-binding protein [Clostridiales bacterium]